MERRHIARSQIYLRKAIGRKHVSKDGKHNGNHNDPNTHEQQRISMGKPGE
nr:hypothetical protein [Pectobacterium brasiliense]